MKSLTIKSGIQMTVAAIGTAAVLFNGAVQAQGLPESYDFGLGVTYAVSSGKKEGALKKGETMGVWFSKGAHTGIEPTNQKGFFMVVDAQSQKMVTFMTEQKMAMVMDMGKMAQKIQSKEGEKVPDVKITKVGTETVLGYNCTIYNVESDDTNTRVWVTTELEGGMGSFSAAMSNMFKNRKSAMLYPDLKGIDNGVMLKLHSTDKKSGDISVMEATNVDKGGKKISTTAYKVMSMPG
ncbi:MAG TPA: DUF4412 domain-containing protein [Flavihumibacter sp.]